jgi:hypothetical protein
MSIAVTTIPFQHGHAFSFGDLRFEMVRSGTRRGQIRIKHPKKVRYRPKAKGKNLDDKPDFGSNTL